MELEKNPEFLKKKYEGFHTTEAVKKAATRTEKRTKERVSEKPEELIQNYLDRFSELVERKDPIEKKEGIEALKKVLFQKLIIKDEDVPARVFELEQEIAEQAGHGKIEITDEYKKLKIEQIQEDQKKSLEKWIDYLSSPDAIYPDWAKYWVFRSVTQMGGYSKKEKKFGSRTKNTAQAFPMLNAGAVADTVGYIQKHLEIVKLSKNDPIRQEKEEALLEDLNYNEEERRVLSTENFSKIYTVFLEKFSTAQWENLENIKGIWKKYNDENETQELVDSLKDWPLEWCTRNETVAYDQLSQGNFYVYYSENYAGEPVVPRLAIRMIGSQEIAEVRGIEESQNIDQYIQPVLAEKLLEFGDEGALYRERSENMKMMTDIVEKQNKEVNLTKEEVKFLYELERPIIGFGYDKDPRIKEVLQKRDKKKDFAVLYDINPEQLAFTEEEALSEKYIYYIGDLSGDLNLTSIDLKVNHKLPSIIYGSLAINFHYGEKPVVLPKKIYGSLSFRKVPTALFEKKYSLPEYVQGSIYLLGASEKDLIKLQELYPEHASKMRRFTRT